MSFQILSEFQVKHHDFSKHHRFSVELGHFEVLIRAESGVKLQSFDKLKPQNLDQTSAIQFNNNDLPMKWSAATRASSHARVTSVKSL